MRLSGPGPAQIRKILAEIGRLKGVQLAFYTSPEGSFNRE
jgi:hypothetical protein